MRHGYTVAWVGWQPDVPRSDGSWPRRAPRAGRDRLRPLRVAPQRADEKLPLADRYHIPHAAADVNDPTAG